jgi:hypothetical protein
MKKAELLPILKILREAGVPFALAGGPVDIEDARTIFRIMNKKLDMEYLKSEFKRCRLSLEKLTNGARQR